MTVSYQSDVASSTSGGLIKLLWRWRGSVWKLVYRELLIFQLTFIGLALSYRFLLEGIYKLIYEHVVIFCSGFVDMIPLSFILGFYVSFTASRWWNQYTAIPWPDKLMNNIALYVPGNDETSRMLRRTLMRYANLSLVLVLRSISIAVKRRFPTKEHLIEAGFMNKTELDMYSSVPSTEFNTFWIPCTWFVNLLREARQDCRITDSSGLKLIMEEFNEFRNKCGLLWSYDWVSIPLVYTQVVTLATYSFFIASVFGRQYIDRPYPPVFKQDFEHKGENLIPVFSIIQFLLYMGLLKLGEQLINPFGDDDEDFELNWIIDRHIKVSFLGVDILNARAPPLVKDNYFDETDIKLPYTAAAVSYKKKTYRGSMAAYHVPSEQQGLVLPEFDEDDEDEDFFNTNLYSTGSQKGHSSLWSVFGKGSKDKSASLISLDSEENYDQQMDTWVESNGSLNVPFQLQSYQEQILDEEFIEPEINYPEPVQATQNIIGGISKESSQDSSDRVPIQMTRKASDTPSSCSHSLKVAPGSQRGSKSSGTGSMMLNSATTLELASAMLKTDAPKKSARKSSAPQRPPSLSFSSASKGSDKKGTGSASSSNASTAQTNNEKKQQKSVLFRKADPRLKIKPFKSKVTFSDDPVKAPATSMVFDRSPLKRLPPMQKAAVAAVTNAVSDVVDEMDDESLIQYRALLNLPILLPNTVPAMDLTISSPELSEAHLLNTYLQGQPAPGAGAEFGLPLDARLAGALSKHRASTVGIAGELGSAIINRPPLRLPTMLRHPLLEKKTETKKLDRAEEAKFFQLVAKRSSSIGNVAVRKGLPSQVKLIELEKPGSMKALRNEIPQTRLARPSGETMRRQSVTMPMGSGTIGGLAGAGTLAFRTGQTSVNTTASTADRATQKADYWLHHQSLPNIQELVEESGSESASSPTAKKMPEVLKEEKPHSLVFQKTKSKENASQERRRAYSKNKSKESRESSVLSTNSIDSNKRKPKPYTSTSRQSSSESEGFETARSIYIAKQVRENEQEDSSSSIVSYGSAKDFPYAAVSEPLEEIEVIVELAESSIPTIVVMSTSPVASQLNLDKGTVMKSMSTDLKRQEELHEEEELKEKNDF